MTTIPETAAARPPDLVTRQFKAVRPNQLWGADPRYVATGRGFAYVAFVIRAVGIADDSASRAVFHGSRRRRR